MKRTTDSSIAPVCPRCRYDLSGIVATWQQSCPVRGVCSECGLDLEWRLVFHPEYTTPVWFVEIERPLRKRFALVRTMLWVLLPWRFWRAVRVETPIRWRGVAVWVMVLLLLYLPMQGVLDVIVVGIVRALNATTFAGMRGSLNVHSTFDRALGEGYLEFQDRWIRFRTGWGLWQSCITPHWISVGIASMCAMPLMFLMLPWTRARSKVHGVLVLRAAAYSLAWAFPFFVWALVSWACQIVISAWPPAPPWVMKTQSLWHLLVNAAAERSPYNWSEFWSNHNNPSPWGLALISFGWLAIFWLFAMKRSWRMPDWLPAWLSICAVAGVLSFFVLLLDERFMSGWL